MLLNTSTEYKFDGQQLKRRMVASVSDAEAYKVVSQNPTKFLTAGDPTLRPNLLKARDEALYQKAHSCNPADPWVREIVNKWVELSELPKADADFWRDAGFMAALRAGRDIWIRRFLDDDGWGWIVVRDSPNHWTHKRRLPESTRQKMVAALNQKKDRFKRHT